MGVSLLFVVGCFVGTREVGDGFGVVGMLVTGGMVGKRVGSLVRGGGVMGLSVVDDEEAPLASRVSPVPFASPLSTTTTFSHGPIINQASRHSFFSASDHSSTMLTILQ